MNLRKTTRIHFLYVFLSICEPSPERMQEATESQQKVKNRNNKNELTIDLKEEDALFVGEEERTGRILTVKSPNMVDFTEYIKLRNVC